MANKKKSVSTEIVELNAVVANPERKHALVAPSGMWAVKLCPYTAKLTYDWDKGDTEASKRGTLLHEAVYNDEVFASLPEDDKAIVANIRKMFIEPIKDNPEYKINYELRLELHDKQGNLLTWGIIDYLVFGNNGKTAQLLDWKYGFKPVDKFWYNDQLKCYSAMVYQNFPELEEIFSMPVQPAVGISFDNMAHSTRVENYETFLEEAEKIVKLGTEATEADAKPSVDVCWYCRKDKCPAYQQSMMSACEAYNLSVISNEDLAELPSAELLAFCDDRKRKCEMVKQIIKEQEAIINQPIINNGGSDNYKVIKPYMRKTVNWEAIARSLGATEEMIEANTTYSSSGEPYLRRKIK